MELSSAAASKICSGEPPDTGIRINLCVVRGGCALLGAEAQVRIQAPSGVNSACSCAFGPCVSGCAVSCPNCCLNICRTPRRSESKKIVLLSCVHEEGRSLL